MDIEDIFEGYRDEIVSAIVEDFADEDYDIIAKRIVEDDVDTIMYSSVVYDICHKMIELAVSDAIYILVIENLPEDEKDLAFSSGLYKKYLAEISDDICEEIGSSYKLSQAVSRL